MSKRKFERKQLTEQEAASDTLQDTSAPLYEILVERKLNSETGQEVQSEKRQLYNPRPLLNPNSSEGTKNPVECGRALRDNKFEGIKVTDPTTTNLFITNINGQLIEDDLIKIFGVYGPIASVKIMWPNRRNKNRRANCGFVAFMSRKDGERAMEGLKGRYDMGIQWGNPVALPQRPINIRRKPLNPDSPSPYPGLPFNTQPLKQPFKRPPLPHYTKGMPEHLINSDEVNKSLLSDAQKLRFLKLIQTLNLSKSKVGEAMVFCLNHADAAKDIVRIIVDSFHNYLNDPPKQIAKLYLLCDILHNCTRKICYSPIYHTQFENLLPDIFKKLHNTYTNILNSIEKDLFKSKVFTILKSWNLQKVYSNDYLYSLEKILLGIDTENENDDESDTDEPLDGAKLRERSIGTACSTTNVLKINVIQEIKPTAKPILKPSAKRTLKQEHSLSGFIVSKWDTFNPEQDVVQAKSPKKSYNLEIERRSQKGTINNEKQSENISKKCETKTSGAFEMGTQYQDDQQRRKRKRKRKHKKAHKKTKSDTLSSSNTDTSQPKRKKHKTKYKKHHNKD